MSTDTTRFIICIALLGALVVPGTIGAQDGPRSPVSQRSAGDDSPSGFRVLSRPRSLAEEGGDATNPPDGVNHGIISEVRNSTRERYRDFWVREDEKLESLRLIEESIREAQSKGENAQVESLRRAISVHDLEPSQRSIDVMEWFGLFQDGSPGMFITSGIDIELQRRFYSLANKRFQGQIHPLAFAAYLADLPGGEPVPHAYKLLAMLVDQLQQVKSARSDAPLRSIDVQLERAQSIMALLDANRLGEAQDLFDQAWIWVVGGESMPSPQASEGPSNTSEESVEGAATPTVKPLLLHCPDPLVSPSSFLQQWYERRGDELIHARIPPAEYLRFMAKAEYLTYWNEIAGTRRTKQDAVKRELAAARNGLEHAKKFRQRDLIDHLQEQVRSLEATLASLQGQSASGNVVSRLDYVQDVAKEVVNNPVMNACRSLLFYCADLASEQREQGGVGGTTFRLEQLKATAAELAGVIDENDGVTPFAQGQGDKLLPFVLEADDIIELLNAGELTEAQARLDAKWDWIMAAQAE